jgi:hypothetical protein
VVVALLGLWVSGGGSSVDGGTMLGVGGLVPCGSSGGPGDSSIGGSGLGVSGSSLGGSCVGRKFDLSVCNPRIYVLCPPANHVWYEKIAPHT